MGKILMIYPDRCTGCRNCIDTCAFEHDDTSRIDILTWEDEDFSVPVVCRQCDDAPCVNVCPTKAMHHGPPGSNLVEYDKELCIGCKLCVIVCPFGGARYDSTSMSIAKCDTCDGDPQCVEICPNEALEFVDDEELTRARKSDVGKSLRSVFK